MNADTKPADRTRELHPKLVGRRIALLREVWHIGTQRELSRRLGVHSHTVGAWERGRSVPMPPDFAAVRDVLKTTLDFVFFGDVRGLPEETLYRLVHRDAPSATIRAVMLRARPDGATFEAR
jgi:DNA-binding transcriptional regulator YiaG